MMSAAKIFYHLYSKTMDPCSMVKDVYAFALDTWLCRNCLAPKPEVREIDIQIQDQNPTNAPLNGVKGAWLPLVTLEFLKIFDPNMIQKDFYIGKVSGPSGTPLSKWVTLRGKRKVVIRGVEHVRYGKCDNCGQVRYFAIGKRYLFPEPPKDSTLFESDLGGIVLPENLFKLINLNRWRRRLYIDKLEVPSQPADGLGIL